MVFSQGLSESSSSDELDTFSVTKSVTYSIRDMFLKIARFKTKLTKGQKISLLTAKGRAAMGIATQLISFEIRQLLTEVSFRKIRIGSAK